MAFFELKSVVLLLVASLVGRGYGYSAGAPALQCTDQNPTGHGVDAQAGGSPYTIMLDGSFYTPGTMRMITVKGTNAGTALRGLTCQVRLANEVTTAVSTFELMSGDTDLQLLTCGSTVAAAITHTNGDDKDMVQFNWMPPTTDVGAVKVMCTVVQVRSTYWRGVLSEQMTFMQGDATTTTTTTTTEGENSASMSTGSSMAFALSAVLVCLRNLF